MKINLKNISWEGLLNVAMITGICFSLMTALYIQIFWIDLPCPLCLLQRVGFCAIALGLLLNLRFGFKPLHYSIVLISGLLTMALSLRQIVLHIIPGTGAYGSPLFGLHLYTWVFIAAFTVLVSTSALLGSSRQYTQHLDKKHWRIITQILFAVLFTILLANALTTIQLCGFSACPGNPLPEVVTTP